MGSQKHTLKVNEGFLENSLAEVIGNVLCCSGLQMEPDASSAGSEAGITAQSTSVNASVRLQVLESLNTQSCSPCFDQSCSLY